MITNFNSCENLFPLNKRKFAPLKLGRKLRKKCKVPKEIMLFRIINAKQPNHLKENYR